MLSLLALLGLYDTAPGLFRTKGEVRSFDCERLDAQTGSQRYPGVIQPPRPRGDYVERSQVVCRQRIVRAGLRAPADEAILSTLEASTVDLAETVVSLRPDLEGSTWLVEAYHPSGPVAAKVAFATKNVLVGRGLTVTDRTPTLGAGDVDVITRMPPDEAYRTACRRYHDTGSLREGDALLAIVHRDRRETVLHAGLCVGGAWTWLR